MVKRSLKLNEGIIKQLTGGDEISVREIYGRQIKIKPVAKYIMLSNHKPIISVGDEAIVDRVRYILCNARFTETPKNGEFLRDHKFIEKLFNDYFNEVFTWLCSGAYQYYSYMEKGKPLPIPKSVNDAKTNYINELDNVSQYIQECFEYSETSTINRTNMYAGYKTWKQGNAEGELISVSDFYKRLDKLGHKGKIVNGTRLICGIRLREPILFD
jgi:putative DNA primase/helicase